MKGVIKRLKKEGFFGFIQPEEGGKDVFFHGNDVTGGKYEELEENDQVTFDMGDSPKGPKATNVAKA